MRVLNRVFGRKFLPGREGPMGLCLRIIVMGSLAALAASGKGVRADAPDRRCYVAPYGLTKKAVESAEAPNLLQALLAEGGQDQQDAAIRILATDRQKTGRELGSVAEHFRKADQGVQAVVWRNTRNGKCKRASKDTSFDPESDRIEVVFTKFDLKALEALPRAAPNPLTDESKKWVAELVKAGGKDPKRYQAAQALFGGLGGSGDYRQGNIFPLSRTALKKVEEMSWIVVLARSVERPPGSPPPTPCWLVVFQYPDAKSRIPSKIQYYFGFGSRAWGGGTVENKE